MHRPASWDVDDDDGALGRNHQTDDDGPVSYYCLLLTVFFSLTHTHTHTHSASSSMVSSWAGMAAAAGVGWVCGATVHSRRLRKKLQTKFKHDQKELYQQYYNDVYALQQQNAELVSALETQYGTGSSRRTK